MTRALTMVALLAACQRVEIGAPAAPPPDHTRAFVTDHAHRTDCERCHREDACARCHRLRAPRDHRPGFAGPSHAAVARTDPARCSTCHVRTECRICHPDR